MSKIKTFPNQKFEKNLLRTETPSYFVTKVQFLNEWENCNYAVIS